MISAPPRARAQHASLPFALVALALAGCAEGATLDLPPSSSNGDGNGGSSSGEGGRHGDGGSSAGDGGSHSSPSSSNVGVTSVTSTNGVTSVTSSSVASSGQSTSATTSGVTTAATTTAATTSSTGGGPVDCDPLNPAPACGGGEHCFPAPDGVTGCGGAGAGQDYDSCADHTDCTPLDVCINFGPVCCQQLCTSDFDCPGFDSCYPFDTPLYDGNGNEYGFCNNGFFDCVE